ncbi:hypothetical protein FQA39_LY01826 [Lamprigera yunnana]|nr:hypothetical protein FQA39_LY01826 [Lamprigera yunnana]
MSRINKMVYNLPRSPSPRAKFPSIPLRYTHRKPTKLFSRTRTLTLDTATTNTFLRREANTSRRQSLPPIPAKNEAPTNLQDKFDREMGGETSGYGSDNHTPEYMQQHWNQNVGYESSLSARDDRAKWGDRGVGVGRFWDPQEIKYNTDMNDPPGWVKRGLEGETELIVANSSPSESPEQEYPEQRPFTSSSTSQIRTYIRGQNNPIDPVELAERERKRQLARAHQEAIRQQLEEKEKRKRLERERRIREEYEEELRIEREQQLERKRREQENLILLAKQEREQKRKEALEEAIHIAEKEALEQKRKHKFTKQINLNMYENVVDKEKVISPRPIAECTKIPNNLLHIDEEKIIEELEDEEEESTKVNNKTITNNSTNKKETNLNRNRCFTPPGLATAPAPVQPTQENVIVVQTPFDNYHMPFAILMPTFAQVPTTPLPLTATVPVNTEEPRPRTKNRILTPTQYRTKQLCDSSTQTDTTTNNAQSEPNKEVKSIKEKLVNLEINDEERTRREHKSRSGERIHAHQNDRPKWGANRPPTRYLKQSEKDPFYQRKKTRQKSRQIKVYDDKNNNYSPHSSDESQVCTPRSYRTKGYIEKRRTRAMWQKTGQVFAKNVRVYQTEIVPLETDKDQIYYGRSECLRCCCDCRSRRHKFTDEYKVVDILKIEHSPRDDTNLENSECLPDCQNLKVNAEVLEKLNSLHNGLIMKQELWENLPCTPNTLSKSTEIS